MEVEAAAASLGAEAGEGASGAPRRGAGPGPCVGAGESWVVATREELRRLFLRGVEAFLRVESGEPERNRTASGAASRRGAGWRPGRRAGLAGEEQDGDRDDELDEPETTRTASWTSRDGRD